MSDLCLNSLSLSSEVLSEIEVLCLFGFSLEQIKSEFEKWTLLEGKSLIVFTSDELCFSQESSNCHFVFSSQETTDFETFAKLCQKKAFQKFFFHSSLKQDETALQCQLIQWQTDLFASDFQDFGIKVFKNTLKNSQRETKAFSSLKGGLKGIPALICGAGPSLKESLPYLKDLEGRGIVFSGGAALNALSEGTIQIGAGVDPDPLWERFFMQGGFDVPFFYQNRFSSDLLDRIHGSLFKVPSNPNYLLERWIEEGELEFEGGWTATSFCAALAVYLECSPLIFIGMDLSYTKEGCKYEDSTIKGKDDLLFFKESLTQKDWVIVAKWLEAFVQEHPDVSFYTVSPSGLPIQGVVKTSFQELFKTELLHSYDISGKIHAIQEMAPLQDISLQKEKIEILQSSFESSLSLVSKLLDLYSSHYPEDPTEKGGFVLLLFDLYEEVVYQKILEPLWKVWEGPLVRNVEGAYAKDLSQLLFFKKILEEYLCKIAMK